jgi:alanine-synthesizing transaminase
VRAEILERIRANARELRQLAKDYRSIEILPADAGWSSVLRVPSTRSEEEMVIDLLETAAVVVHPGFFFDFAHEAFLVVSLLPPPAIFSEGVRRVMELAHA